MDAVEPIHERVDEAVPAGALADLTYNERVLGRHGADHVRLRHDSVLDRIYVAVAHPAVLILAHGPVIHVPGGSDVA